MAPGIPTSLESSLLRVVENLPESLQDILQRRYQEYVRLLLKTKVWVHIDRHQEANLKPLFIYHISPKKVKYRSQNTTEFFYSDVRSGNWDKNLPLFSESTVYKSFVNRFENNKLWEQTQYYSEAIEQIRMKGRWRNCTAEHEVRARFKEYDELYSSISEEGYNCQLDLSLKNIEWIHDRDFHPPELREITVDIGRHGEYIWVNGQHRLTIAKILNLEEIPVRVRTRHRQWQKYRNSVVRSGNEVSGSLDHPDLTLSS